MSHKEPSTSESADKGSGKNVVEKSHANNDNRSRVPHRKNDDVVVDEDPQRKSRAIKLGVFLVVLVILVAVGGGYLALRMAMDDAEIEDREDPEAPVDRIPDEEEFVPQDGENPFGNEFEETNVSDDTEIVSEEDGQSFVFSDSGISITVDENDGSVTETSGAECELVSENDICYAGYIDFEDDDLNVSTIEVFAVKNIAENRLFETTSDVESTSVNGSRAAFIGNIEIDAEGYAVPFVAAAGDNGSGFLFMINDDGEREISDIDGIQPYLTVQD